jgi:hypothetical protein
MERHHRSDVTFSIILLTYVTSITTTKNVFLFSNIQTSVITYFFLHVEMPLGNNM